MRSPEKPRIVVAMPSPTVHRLCSREEWENARAAGSFEGGDTDRRDGFIHLSSIDQVAETARIYFPKFTNLWILDIDADALGAALRWERSRGGDVFPHCYGPIPVSAVRAARPYARETTR